MTVDAVCTIGHGTRSAEELADVLSVHGVVELLDVRTIPRSRTNPQFDEAVLPASLAPRGITYARMPALGGLRGKPKTPPPVDVSAWDNEAFRNYAAYATTPAFRRGLDDLLARAEDARRRGGRVAVLCAEHVWWRCHRRIIADHLLARGIPVVHLLSATKSEPATLTPFARVVDGLVAYPSLP